MQEMCYEYLDETYQAIALLGSGEKKSNYLARDRRSGKIVVKKYISPENSGIYEQLKGIRHRNLISIFSVAKKEENALVIMEYVSGQTLEEYSEERGLFSEDETDYYLKQLLEGLAEVHAKGIVHRDINPKNILISTDRVLKILDFDIGRFYKLQSSCDTEILGTVGYAAPEQFGFGQSDRRSDIFAVGAVANQMLLGVLPQEKTYQKGMLGKLIGGCIPIDPAHRYQDVNDILSEFYLKQRTANIWPGFRSNRLWKKVVASAYYILMAIYSVASIVECAKAPLPAVLEGIAVGMYVWLTVFLPLNFLGWMERMPIVRTFGKTGKVIFGVLLWLGLFCAGYSLEQYVRIDMLHFPPSANG